MLNIMKTVFLFFTFYLCLISQDLSVGLISGKARIYHYSSEHSRVTPLRFELSENQTDWHAISLEHPDWKEEIQKPKALRFLFRVHTNRPLILTASHFKGLLYLNGKQLSALNEDKNQTPLNLKYFLTPLKSDTNIITVQLSYWEKNLFVGNYSTFTFHDLMVYADNQTTVHTKENLYAGLFFMSFFIALLFYIYNPKETSLLYFTLFCLAFAFSNSVNYIFLKLNIQTVENYMIYLYVYDICVSLYLVFGMLFISYHTQFKRTFWLIGFYGSLWLICILLIPNEFLILQHTLLIKLLALLPYFVLIGSSFKRKYRVLHCATLVYLASMLLEQFYFSESFTLIYSALFVITFFVLIIKDLNKKREALEHAKSESARLQFEILKKNIQPHYLMNSLESILHWLDENPENASKAIDALSEEFRIFSKISDKKKISVKNELRLCRAHINIMRYRKNCQYHLTTEHVDETKMVPPGIFHTLIENGITHSPNSTICQFKLSFKVKNNMCSYTMINTHQHFQRDESSEEGLGLKYIKSRLNELYGDAWELTSYAIDEGWKTEILIRKDVYEASCS